MTKTIFLCLLFVIFVSLHESRRTFDSSNSELADLCAQISIFNQQIDHFNFNPQFDSKFKQRYIISEAYWKNSSGPIFFYTGNEGNIQWFCENTGFVWEIAKKFDALVVFAEHRYYGESIPFSNNSFIHPYIDFLTSEQALADYVYLIKHLKSTFPGASDSPVIAFGGSYGGMLSSWLRMKYPNIVAGAIAASAPVLQFTADCNSFSAVTTSAFDKADPKCTEIIRQSWDAINSISGSSSGLKELTEIFRLCSTLRSGQILKDWLVDIYCNIAMANYPYATNFLSPLPAWPVKAMCANITTQFFEEVKSSRVNDPTSILKAIVNGVDVYLNYTGDKTCFDVGSSSAPLDHVMNAWEYQTCTEFVFPWCNNGKSDMFEPTEWDPKQNIAMCASAYETKPRDEWPSFQYGTSYKDLKGYSNIVFSNGELDPWSSGGVLKDVNKNVISILIEDGAHHLDLRSSNPLDTKSVKNARLREIEEIQKWIEEWAE